MTRTESLFGETINDFCNKIGTLQPKACSMVCPQLLAKADIRAIRGPSGFDPERTIGGQFCCAAQCSVDLLMMW
jgi:hypothetical protein